MKCRGANLRKKIVENYEVIPVLHTVLLNGQKKYSDAEAIIKNEYYIFKVIDKNNNEVKIIQCGMGAARDFLKYLNHPGLPIFNPIKSENIDLKQKSNKKIINNSSDEWNSTAKQLYNAIMWIIILWNSKPETVIFKFKDDIIKYRKYKPFDFIILRVNNLLKKDRSGKTLTEKINSLKAKNKIKKDICDFSLLNKEIERIKNETGKEIKSYF
ncbi:MULTISPECIES: hypothetical protein [Fusobacterium]|uniref:hypothetical protein n=1 Tax=Fusobacterium TaxID=848 RepID=UPI00198116C4|nr:MULTISPECIES: hypothetical protein [Fusobacterium]